MRVRAPLAACMRRMGCPDARTKRSAFFLCLLPVEMRCFSFAGGMAVHGPPVPCPAEPASAPGGSLATRPSHVAPPPPLGVLVDEQRVRLGVEDGLIERSADSDLHVSSRRLLGQSWALPRRHHG